MPSSNTAVAIKINAQGSKWSKTHPRLKDRILRALDIVRKGNVLPAFVKGSFLVLGSEPGTIYRVTLKPNEKGTCTCQDFASGRAVTCKHVLAVRLLERVDSLPAIPAAAGYGLDSEALIV